MRTLALTLSAIVAGLVPSAAAAPALEAFAGNTVAKFGRDLSANNHYGAPHPPWHLGSKPGWCYGSHIEKSSGTPSLAPYSCTSLDHYSQAIHCTCSYPPATPHNSPTSLSSTTREHLTQSSLTQLPHSITHSSDSEVITVYTQSVYSTSPTLVYTPLVSYTTTTLPQTTYTPVYISPTPPYDYYPTFSSITAAVQADDYLTFGLVDTVDDCKVMCDSIEGCSFVNTYYDVNGKDGSPRLTCSLFSLCHGAKDADNRGGQNQPDGSTDFIVNSDGWCKS